MDNAQVKTVLRMLDASWPASKPLDADTVRLWGAELVPYDFEAVAGRVRELLASSKFRPSFAELVGPLRSGVTASESFAHVWHQISKRPPTVDAVEAEVVRRLGGWDRLRAWPIDDRHWLAKRYAEIFDDVTEDPRWSDAIGAPALPPGDIPQAALQGDATPGLNNGGALSYEQLKAKLAEIEHLKAGK